MVVRGARAAVRFATAIQYRGAEGQLERLPALAAEFIRHPVSVIVAAGVTVALAAKAATTTVPIVFTIAGDPVELGLVASIWSPGRLRPST